MASFLEKLKLVLSDCLATVIQITRANHVNSLPILVPSADNLSKQFGFRSGPTFCRA